MHGSRPAWLKADGDPQIVRTYYLDLPATERAAVRARVIRQQAGVLSGHALGLDGAEMPRSFAAAVLSVFGDSPRLWTETLAARLAGRIPEAYADITAAAVASQLRSVGITVKKVREARPGPSGGLRPERGRGGHVMRTVPLREQPATSTNARRPEHWNTPARADLPCSGVPADAQNCPHGCSLDEKDSWPAETTNTVTTSAGRTTARGSRARPTKRATSAATPMERRPATRLAWLTGSRRATPRALLLPVVLAGSHPHLRPAAIALAVIAAAIVYVLVAVALPTRRTPAP